ncbi:hypothetical protein CRUP_005273, partial [Coryphaenoides rupestris]
MGVDLSPEGVAARNRRGVAVIVHGAPLAGKSSVAASLASHYGGACFTLDGVVTEALTAGSSPACLAARQLYLQAATELAQKRAAEAGPAVQDAPGGEAPPTPSFGGGALSVEDVSHGWDSPAPARTQDSLGTSTGSKDGGIQHIISQVGGADVLRRLLPHRMLVDLLAERLQCVYTPTVARALQVALGAINNRRHIYLVDLCDVGSAGREAQGGNT